jgi:hypothetical protein
MQNKLISFAPNATRALINILKRYKYVMYPGQVL